MFVNFFDLVFFDYESMGIRNLIRICFKLELVKDNVSDSFCNFNYESVRIRIRNLIRRLELVRRTHNTCDFFRNFNYKVIWEERNNLVTNENKNKKFDKLELEGYIMLVMVRNISFRS